MKKKVLCTALAAIMLLSKWHLGENQLNSPDGELNVLRMLNYFVVKLTFGQFWRI